MSFGDVDGSTDYVCFTNAAGSVVQLVDRSDASVDAKYVYDVNGDTVRNTGAFAGTNPLRFGTMYYDAELDYANTSCDGLYCSATGDFYSPRLGRFMQRDPADYQDGEDLNQCVGSGPLNATDPTDHLMDMMEDFCLEQLGACIGEANHDLAECNDDVIDQCDHVEPDWLRDRCYRYGWSRCYNAWRTNIAACWIEYQLCLMTPWYDIEDDDPSTPGPPP